MTKTEMEAHKAECTAEREKVGEIITGNVIKGKIHGDKEYQIFVDVATICAKMLADAGATSILLSATLQLDEGEHGATVFMGGPSQILAHQFVRVAPQVLSAMEDKTEGE